MRLERVIFQPEATIRDYRLTGSKNLRVVGVRATVAEAKLQKKADAFDKKRVYNLAKRGVAGFGNVKDLYFRKSVEARIGEELPAVLDEFVVTPGSKDYAGPGSPVFEAVMEYVKACFAAYEEEIHRLNCVIRKLKKENKKLAGGVVGAAVATVSRGLHITESEWKDRTLRRHAASLQMAVEKESGGCPVKAITLAREVLRRLDGDYGKEQRASVVNEAVVSALRSFYAVLKNKHMGRMPKHDHACWSTVNSVLGGVKGVPLTEVAAAVQCPVERLYEGKKRWDAWLGVDEDNEGEGQKYLQDLHTHLHGNAWPPEWTAFIIEMWQDERVTRKGEGINDYCRDPKIRKGSRPFHVVHWLEKKMVDVQEIMQAEGEIRFPPEFVYVDGKARTGFPKRPKPGREKHGGGIGKTIGLLRPYFVKVKGRDLCLCWRHLEFDLLCEALYLWRQHNKRAHRGAPPIVRNCCCVIERDPYKVRKSLLCPRTGEAAPDGKPRIGVDFDRKACLERTCPDCSGLSRLEICNEELAVTRPVIFMRRENVEYETNKGEKRIKKDFVKCRMPIKEFLAGSSRALQNLRAITPRWLGSPETGSGCSLTFHTGRG